MKLAAAARRLKQSSGRPDAAFCLAFMTDGRRIPAPEIVARALPKGAALVLRDYDNPRRGALAARLKSICAPRGVLLIVGGDPGLASAVGADGVHFPSFADPFASLPETMIRTVACHTASDLMRASKAGADIAFLAPAFATDSHPGARSLGAAAVKALARTSQTPVIALGGVDEANALQLQGPNIAGIAAIGAFLG